MTKGHCLMQLGSGGAVSPLKILKFCILQYPDEAKSHPVYLCTEYKIRRNTHQIQEPMKKEKFAQHVFITLGKLKLQMNLQISLHAQGPMPKTVDQKFSLEHLLKFKNMVTIFTNLQKE